VTRRGFFVVAGLLLGAAGIVRGADAAADWKQIEAMETNAPAAQSQWKTRAEAQAGTIEYLCRQKEELLAFIASYPQDAHVPDAKMRLAHLLATLGDLEQQPRLRREAEAIARSNSSRSRGCGSVGRMSSLRGCRSSCSRWTW